MAENRSSIVIFGAGMTGRGHIAQLVFESGCQITFVDKDRELVNILSNAGAYTVRLISENSRDAVISGYKILHSDDKIAVAKAIAESDIVITSVLPNNLSAVAPILADGLRLRLQNESKNPINVIAAENMNEGSAMLWSLTSKHLSVEEQKYYGQSYGFPNSMVARVVPRSSDPLFILTEDYNEWTADLTQRVGDPPSINGLEWVSNQNARLNRKLYIHNTGHAVCAYLGILKGYKFIHESARDKWIISNVEKAISESGQAVAKEYGFDDLEIKAYAQSLIDRLPKDALPDSLDRVTREPIRKLGARDRFIGPLALCEKYGLPRKGLCLGISAVMASDIKDDEGARLTAGLMENGVKATISKISGYTPNTESINLIEESYNFLKKKKHF